jgi:hypothetical protein
VHDLCRTVRAAVIDDEYMEALLQTENGPNDFLNILFFVVGGNNDDAVAGIHVNWFYIAKIGILF